MANDCRIKRGTLFVISAPSGAGKSTLCQRLLKNVPDVRLSVSYTTRRPRRGEQNDVDYTFVSERRFMNMIKRSEFAEWAMVHNNLYGTSLKRLKKLQKQGYDIILDIDTRGARQIRKNFDGAVYIFILPPSIKELEKRLKKRKTDSADAIAQRLVNAREEILNYELYDYVIINDKLDRAYRELEGIILSTRIRRELIDGKWIQNLVK